MFIVEDGTGRADATSLVAVATIDAYWADRGGSVAWTALTTPQKEQQAIRASDYFRANARYRWRGQKASYAQRMPFPRTGCVERTGQAVPDTVVPWQLAEAVCALAPRAADLTVLLPDLARGGMVKQEAYLNGLTNIVYADRAPTGTVLQAIDGLLTELLLADRESGAILDFQPSLPPLPDVLLADTFAPFSISTARTSEP
jgi:hypothetical protein